MAQGGEEEVFYGWSDVILVGCKYAVLPHKTLMHWSCQNDQETTKSQCWCKPCCIRGASICDQVCNWHKESGLKIVSENSNKHWILYLW